MNDTHLPVEDRTHIRFEGGQLDEIVMSVEREGEKEDSPPCTEGLGDAGDQVAPLRPSMLNPCPPYLVRRGVQSSSCRCLLRLLRVQGNTGSFRTRRQHGRMQKSSDTLPFAARSSLRQMTSQLSPSSAQTLPMSFVTPGSSSSLVFVCTECVVR